MMLEGYWERVRGIKISTTNNWRVCKYAIIHSKSHPNLICVYKHVYFLKFSEKNDHSKLYLILFPKYCYDTK